MASKYKKAADRIRGHAGIIPIFLTFFTIFLFAIWFMADDYLTSLWGLEKLNVAMGFTWTKYFIAALPQLGQIAATFFYLTLDTDEDDEDNPDRPYRIMAFAVAAFLFTLDFSTDIIHRFALAQATIDYVASVFLTLGVFTLGSEVAFTVCFAMTVELAPDVWAQFDRLYRRAMSKPVRTPPDRGRPDRPDRGRPDNQPGFGR